VCTHSGPLFFSRPLRIIRLVDLSFTLLLCFFYLCLDDGTSSASLSLYLPCFFHSKPLSFSYPTAFSAICPFATLREFMGAFSYPLGGAPFFFPLSPLKTVQFVLKELPRPQPCTVHGNFTQSSVVFFSASSRRRQWSPGAQPSLFPRIHQLAGHVGPVFLFLVLASPNAMGLPIEPPCPAFSHCILPFPMHLEHPASSSSPSRPVTRMTSPRRSLALVCPFSMRYS